MIPLSLVIFFCAGFFFLKSLRENTSQDRLIALVLLVIGLIALFAGLHTMRVLNQYGI